MMFTKEMFIMLVVLNGTNLFHMIEMLKNSLPLREFKKPG